MIAHYSKSVKTRFVLATRFPRGRWTDCRSPETVRCYYTKQKETVEYGIPAQLVVQSAGDDLCSSCSTCFFVFPITRMRSILPVNYKLSCSIKQSVLDGFGEVLGADVFGVGEVGDGAGEF